MIVSYTSIDGAKRELVTDDLEKARKFAHEWVGEAPDVGMTYAVSFDGVGKITCIGTTLHELFPKTKPEPEVPYEEYYNTDRDKVADWSGDSWAESQERDEEDQIRTNLSIASSFFSDIQDWDDDEDEEDYEE